MRRLALLVATLSLLTVVVAFSGTSTAKADAVCGDHFTYDFFIGCYPDYDGDGLPDPGGPRYTTTMTGYGFSIDKCPFTYDIYNVCSGSDSGSGSGGPLNGTLDVYDDSGTIDFGGGAQPLSADSSTCPGGRLGRLHNGVRWTSRITGHQVWYAIVSAEVCVANGQVTRIGGQAVDAHIDTTIPLTDWVWAYDNNPVWAWGLLPASRTFVQSTFSFHSCPLKAGLLCSTITVRDYIPINAQRGTYGPATATFN